MNLAAFLEAFFTRLTARGVRFCVLRNYDALPDFNIGNDVDLLLEPKDAGIAMGVLRTLPGVSITAIGRRPYVQNICVAFQNSRCLEVDLVTSLSWFGMDYMGASSVLDRVREHPRCPWIPIPDTVDEAIVSFMSSFLIGGFVKEGYADVFQPVFGNQSALVELRMARFMDSRVLRQVLERAVKGDSIGALRYVAALRRTVIMTTLRRRPLALVVGTVRHVLSEVAVHLSSMNLHSIAVLGPDGAGKSTVIRGLRERLRGCSKVIETRHLRPTLPWISPNAGDGSPVLHPHARPPKSWAASIVQLLMWLLAYWSDLLFRRKRNVTLRIYDRYFHDVLIDPRRYRYGGPRWFAALIVRLAPLPNMLIVLDAPTEVIRGRKQEVSEGETERQRQEYLALSEYWRHVHVVDAARLPSDVADELSNRVLDDMVRRTSQRIGGRRM